MGFNLDDYEPVAARLVRWIFSCAERGVQHRVETALVEYGDNRCVFRASIYENDVLIATGHAEETRGDGHVNRTSHLENCETGAVGRALANAGWAGSDVNKRPSREEMSKVARQSHGESPRSPSEGRLAPVRDLTPSKDRKATDKQIAFLKRLMIERAMPTYDVDWDSMSAAECSQQIDALKDVPVVK
jgi:hypothetical protein